MAGSSPLARGLPLIINRRLRGKRIIPARAGFTVVSAPVTDGDGDHPRSRGVYQRFQEQGDHGAGSSPLARGLLVAYSSPIYRSWIIPARAGFTCGRGLPHRGPRDHPRSRGVYHSALAQLRREEGSSPLARGLLRCCSTQARLGGIIPARAGFTVRAISVRRSSRDHPRSRGVYAGVRRRQAGDRGSSPLARGLHEALARMRIRERIIPARAGFTAVRTRGR